MSERYKTLKRIRWPSKQPLIFGDREDEMHDSNQEDNHLEDFEIVGDYKHVEKIRKIFADSGSTRVSIVEDKPPSPSSLRSSNKSRSNISISGGLHEPKAAHGPSFHKMGKASKEAFFTSLNNVLEDTKTDDGVSSDSDKEPDKIVHRRNLSELSSCSLSPEVQNRRDIIRVQNRIVNLGDKSLITPTRLYIKEGEFSKAGSKSKFILFLFNDVLIIGKILQKKIPGMPTRVKFRKALDLTCLEVKVVPDSSKGENLLLLKHYAAKNLHLNKWRRTYSAPNKQQRDEWFADITALREKLSKSSSAASIAATRTLSSPRLVMY